jgi:membrane protease YdiL (CAAX protease family)
MPSIVILLALVLCWILTESVAKSPSGFVISCALAGAGFMLLRTAFPLGLTGPRVDTLRSPLSRVLQLGAVTVLVISSGWAGVQLEQGYCVASPRPSVLQSNWQFGSHVLTAPVLEEALFRGILPRAALRAGWPAWLVWPLSLAVFVSFHSVGVTSLALVLGIVATTLVIRTESIWPSVIVHACVNGAATVLWSLDLGSVGYFLYNTVGLDCLSAAFLFFGGTGAAIVAAWYMGGKPPTPPVEATATLP